MSIPSELRKAILTAAINEVGVREAGGNNRGKMIVEYQKATWLVPDAWPWCAAFTAYVLHNALQTSAGAEYLKAIKETIDTFRCKDASAFGWLKWADKKKLTVFDENHAVLAPEPGDFVVFDFSHIGVVEAPVLTNNYVTHIKTIEGNTAPKTQQRDGSDDGVWRMQRDVKLVRGYIRL